MLRRRMSLGKATGEKFAPAKSTIAGVHNQLEKGFLPGEIILRIPEIFMKESNLEQNDR